MATARRQLGYVSSLTTQLVGGAATLDVEEQADKRFPTQDKTARHLRSFLRLTAVAAVQVRKAQI
jgi:hypothetical protein